MTEKQFTGAPESQRKRFEEAARELGVDLDEDKLKDALRKMKDGAVAPKEPSQEGPGSVPEER
ncbi:hypothetical protein [Albimonas donghaensis]|uniref:hypothetical protein n=1 Tax=Albimonas donghaensis TaxID=356660 RepID=UPI00115F8EEC|nr:hypothetical protein [Albimonas donghaensis]